VSGVEYRHVACCMRSLLRGWSNFYRHAWGAKRVFVALDHHLWWTIYRWLKEKHHHVGMRKIYARYAWRKPGGRMWRWRDGETKLLNSPSSASSGSTTHG
jgi:hypothetical protein